LSINRLSKERDAVGWVRADRAPSGQVLQDLLDTKQKVEELEAQIQKYHEKSESLNPDFAWYADEVTLRGMIDDSANNTIAEFSFSYDWKTLFESIASVILNRDFVTRSNISDHICNMVFASEKTYLNKKKKPRLTIYPKSGYTKTQARDSELKRIMFVNSEHILIAQCVVHHLLEVSDKGIVTLTEFGLRHYYELSAIKRPPSTEMSKLPSDPPHQNLLPNT
ncbi:MAG: hypothetical protein IE925_17210, partial [Rhodobacterales bacterium]|nr:hypothetical protein [Rhodobacterales bacterium]